MTNGISKWMAASLMAMVSAAGIAAQAPGIAPPSGAAPSGGASQGIKVHGHWTIEVRNQDGSLVSRSEFENALAPDRGVGGGATLLAQILGSKQVPGTWGIRFHSNGVNTVFGPCQGGVTPPNGFPCGPSEASGLTVTTPLAGNPPRAIGTIELSGVFTIPYYSAANHISAVETTITQCNAAGACFPIPLTSHILDPVIPITPRQIVQVNVVISFS